MSLTLTFQLRVGRIWSQCWHFVSLFFPDHDWGQLQFLSTTRMMLHIYTITDYSKLHLAFKTFWIFNFRLFEDWKSTHISTATKSSSEIHLNAPELVGERGKSWDLFVYSRAHTESKSIWFLGKTSILLDVLRLCLCAICLMSSIDVDFSFFMCKSAMAAQWNRYCRQIN